MAINLSLTFGLGKIISAMCVHENEKKLFIRQVFWRE